MRPSQIVQGSASAQHELVKESTADRPYRISPLYRPPRAVIVMMRVSFPFPGPLVEQTNWRGQMIFTRYI